MSRKGNISGGEHGHRLVVAMEVSRILWSVYWSKGFSTSLLSLEYRSSGSGVGTLGFRSPLLDFRLHSFHLLLSPFTGEERLAWCIWRLSFGRNYDKLQTCSVRMSRGSIGFTFFFPFFYLLLHDCPI